MAEAFSNRELIRRIPGPWEVVLEDGDPIPPVGTLCYLLGLTGKDRGMYKVVESNDGNRILAPFWGINDKVWDPLVEPNYTKYFIHAMTASGLTKLPTDRREYKL